MSALAQAARAAEQKDEKAAAKAPEFVPGQSTRVDSDKLGSHFIVYVPPNYTPDRTWPIIFCYHGQGGHPTVSPFHRLTDGKNFILVGMPYVQQTVNVPSAKVISSHGYEQEMDVETKALTEVVIPFLCKHLSVDKRLCFVGGTSRGGWVCSTLGENIAPSCAGLIILCAGRERKARPLVNAKWFRKKPVFIGVGEKEVNRKSGEDAARFYARLGAKVTLEIFKGLGHQVDTKNERLRTWLLENGPLRYLKEDLAAAAKLEKAGKLGLAYNIHLAISEVSPTHEACGSAAKAAGAIAEKAKTDLAAAERQTSEKRYAQAAGLLVKLAKTYEGSPFGDTAQQQLAQLKSDPAIQAAIAQAELDDKADGLEAQAKAAEAKKDYATALRLYEQYLAGFAKAGRFAQVKAHLEAMKADKKIMARVRQQEADRECRGWLGIADNYINAGLNAKAETYLRKIIKEYPDTDWAAQARQRLAKIGKSADVGGT
ncbi:MAG: hypothetical protein AMJ81_12155 [Phycisphaerae bacterium SM23_33]|nr:MAG: hypothetical protein AMJ81_12155 [Phycisphaerae bacterium SM23_33]